MIKLYCDDVCAYIDENKTDLINDLRDDGLSISDEHLQAYTYDIIDVIYHEFMSDVKTTTIIKTMIIYLSLRRWAYGMVA